jgi:hypothetical protein
MITHTGSPLYIAVGGLVLCYFAAALLVAKRLKIQHPDVWSELGSPSLLNLSISNSVKLAIFIFFRQTYARLNDRILFLEVWVVRLLFILIFVGLVVLKFGQI